ncbi:hypothetical protein A9K97_gp340 [Tokyovirus A1]|uniref:hypothetical protein n=1 Tax=Tokyovirus A1 TaxID=1826170 RepID=UPI0007A9880F|nr:hypothetical protein A9K97_gp340 [Tokyovirus A1]BAU80011.1 hypothetical protein [Tokyovirus A1]
MSSRTSKQVKGELVKRFHIKKKDISFDFAENGRGKNVSCWVLDIEIYWEEDKHGETDSYPDIDNAVFASETYRSYALSCISRIAKKKKRWEDIYSERCE